MSERRTRRRPGENRERLQEAGLIEFGLFGYHGTSTGRIAARAEVPQPHVYANFRTKQDLFLACLELALPCLAIGRDDAAAELFLYQAYAAAGTPELRAQLTSPLRRISDELGEAALAALLLRAARVLAAS